MYIWCQQFQLGYNLEIIFDAIPRIAMSILIHVFWWLLLLLFTRQVMFDSLQLHEIAAHQTSLSFTILWSLPKLISIELVIPSNHLILCCPLLLLLFPSIRVFSNELALHIRWPKHWSFSFSISPSKEYSGWFPLGLTGWISLQSKRLSESYPTLQYKSINSSRSAFLIVQLSHPYMTTGKTIALTRWTFVGKVISLLFNMLSRLVIAFHPRRKHLLISW